MERELRTMLGLTTSEDPEHAVSAQSLPQAPLREPENSTQPMEPSASSHLIPDPAPTILDPSNPPVQSLNDMQVDQTYFPPAVALPDDQTPAKDDPPVPDLTSSTIKFSERPPLVSESLSQPSWNPIGFVGDEEEEEEEEIPSINMDSDSD